MEHLRYALIFFLFPAFITAQEVTARILDANTRQPVAYASVAYGQNRGVITNDEGTFSINFNGLPANLLVISSLGYEPMEISAADAGDKIILLKPSSIELQEVFISNRQLSAKEVMARAKKAANTNYNFDMSRKKFFFRESHFNTIPTFHLEVDKSTMPGIDQALMTAIADNVPKISDSYKEVLGEMYGNYDSQKLQVIKAANLHDPRSNTSLGELTDELHEHFRQNIKKNSYLKIRSGIIGFKMDAKELEEELRKDAGAEEKKPKTPEELKKQLEMNQKNIQTGTLRGINLMFKNMFWKEGITFNLFEKLNRYRFTLQGLTHIDNETVYVISFKPKRGADYKGTVYVNTTDFGVHRIDYQNVKPIKSFRLFGISTADDIYRGKMIFTKDGTGKYNPQFIEQEMGESVGVSRPLTIIEKNKVVPGRNKQSELDLDIKIRVNQLEKYQLVIYGSEPLEPAAFNSFTASTDFEYQTFRKYNPDFWSGHNIIEPNTAISSFRAFEKK